MALYLVVTAEWTPPGFSAGKGTYSLMDHDSKVIISMKHGQVSKNATCATLEKYYGGQYFIISGY